MKPPIYFNVPEAREYLMKHGVVYTFRKARKAGITTVRTSSFYKFENLMIMRYSDYLDLAGKDPKWILAKEGLIFGQKKLLDH